jgi:hypothetical protein
MSQAIADQVRGLYVVAVSDAYKLAPWADALASTDGRWWAHHKEAMNFKGLKFTAAPDFRPVNGVERFPADSHTNSGLLGIKVAVHMGATQVLLLGFDLRGSHYFGKHPEPLKNTTAQRFESFKKQFAGYRPKGVEIINCTSGSALDCYPKRDLADCLTQSPLLAA